MLGKAQKMKTLIINGSTKKHGDTAALIDEFSKNLKGEVKVLSRFNDISPCIDCRYCWTNAGCSIQDEMQEIYSYLDECDNIVLASPIWFSSLSGPLLNIASRLQTFFAAAHIRKEPIPMKAKNGVIIIVGAEKGTETAPTQNALTIMKLMNVRRPCTGIVYSLNTDQVPAAEDQTALKDAHKTAELLNQMNG